MDIFVSSKKLSELKTNMLVIFFSKEEIKKIFKKGIKPLFKEIEKVIISKDFDGEFKKTMLVHTENKIKRLLLVGLGNEKKIDEEKIRKACYFVLSEVKDLKLETFSILLPTIKKIKKENICKAITEGVILSDYDFNKYKIEERKRVKDIKYVELIFPKVIGKGEKEIIKKTKIVCDNVNLLRDWVNEDSDKLNPLEISKMAKDIAKKYGLKINIFDEKMLKRMGMELIINVGRGSRYPPRVVIMEYKNGKSDNIVLIGKGITFDSGGLDLKPPKYIENMKMDKAGALTVLAIMKTVAEIDMKINLIGIMPLCENMIGPMAYKPGSILKSFSGKTVEVEDTDAEGRLILADILSYAERTFKPKLMVDIATLTGSVLITFGEYVAAMLSNNKKIVNAMFQSGQRTYERVWELPLYDEYLDEIKGDVADIKNLGYKKGLYAGTIIGGAFLRKFIDRTPWIHIDIAGTGWYEKRRYYIPKGATGFGLRLILDFLNTL